MKEIWKDISGYEGKYQVSNFGRVKSLTRKCWNGYKWWTQPGRLLKLGSQKSGYLFVDLLDGHNHARKFRVHRLVAEAFIPNPCNYQQVNHKESTRQALKGFKPVDHSEDPGYWEFVKEDSHGTYTHDFFGQYRNVIGGSNID